jgi:hypothetical protein
MLQNRALRLLAVCAMAFVVAGDGTLATAAVSKAEAEQLRTVLTPLGAERAGNGDGTIPPWTGGYRTDLKDYKSGQLRPDPFSDEKPVLQITAQNMDAYADKLSEGVKLLLKRFPTYRLDVYPTHRTAAAPQWVYDNTLRNATRAHAIHNGDSVEGAYGGIPFPIPKTGAEAMWNHLLAWKGESVTYDFKFYLVTAGNRVLASGGTIDSQYPYYYKDGSLETFRGLYGLSKVITTAPPFRVGQDVLVMDPVNAHEEGRRAWQYLVGQRRVRRAPTIAYDNPNTFASGFTVFDEALLFNGALDRYDWKLIGKREMFVPYNDQRFHAKSVEEVLGPDHVNPDAMRWELHRVWVVEGTLAPGKRHVMPRRRFYLDEDAWIALLSDSWAANGELWHVGQAIPVLVPELPAVVSNPHIIYDIQKRGYTANLIFNEGRHYYEVVPRRSEDAFTPAALAAESTR